MKKILPILFAIWGLQGCDDSEKTDASGDSNSTDTSSVDNNMDTDEEFDTTQDGGEVAGHDHSCGEATYESVSWDEILATGVTPEGIFGPLEGECSSAFAWNATSLDMHTITPQSGQTQMKVTVSFVRDQVRTGRYENSASSRGDPWCPEFIEVPANLSLESEDGIFMESAQVVVQSTDDEDQPTMYLSVPLEDRGGSLQIDLGEGESGRLSYRFSGGDEQCAGNVSLNISMGLGDGTGISTEGEIGSWSATSCGLGETEVDLEAELPAGETVLSAIAKTFGAATYAGTWDDGQTTELKIAVEPAQEVACMTKTTTLVPVQLTYSTTDGRITQSTLPATVDVSFGANGNARAMQLWINHELECASTTDVIAYTAKSCEILEGVTIQASISEFQNGELQVGDDGLNVYERYRNGDAPPGAADNVATLALRRN